MKNNHRKHDRTDMKAEVWYRQDASRSFGGCVAEDVSENGVKLKVGEFFPPGTILELQFKLPLSPTAFIVKGKVTRIAKLPYNEQWELGVDLLMDKNYAALVRQYVAKNK